jgi:hypothetical protein
MPKKITVVDINRESLSGNEGVKEVAVETPIEPLGESVETPGEPLGESVETPGEPQEITDQRSVISSFAKQEEDKPTINGKPKKMITCPDCNKTMLEKLQI